MATTYKRVQVEIGGVRLYPQEARYVLTRDPDQTSPVRSEAVRARASFWVDAHDTARISQDDMIRLWKLVAAGWEEPEKISITYYAEDADRVIANVEFMGWLTTFRTYNPPPGGMYLGDDGTPALIAQSDQWNAFNTILYLEAVAVLDEPHAGKHKLTR